MAASNDPAPPPTTVLSGTLGMSATRAPDTQLGGGERAAADESGDAPGVGTRRVFRRMYGTFRLNFHRFDRFKLDPRGHTQP